MTRRAMYSGFATAMLAGVGACGPSTPELRTIADAIEAIGGADRVAAVRTVAIEGEGQMFNLGQNVRPDGDLPVFDVTELAIAIDLEAGRSRQEYLRTATFPTGLAPVVRIASGLDDGVAFDVGADGAVSRASSLVATDRRRELRHDPIGILQAATAESSTVTNHRQLDGRDVVDIVTAGGDQYTLHVDGSTRLPAKVVSASYQSNLGDVAIETEFSDYVDRDGLMLTSRRVVRVDRYTVADLRISTTINADVGDLMAPAEARNAAEPARTANVTVDTIAPGLWYLAGQSHHSLVVELDDRLVMVEAPQHDTRTLAVIARARELQPDKPLTHVVSTHHHFDHSGGIRAAVSEELTVIAHDLSRPFFEEMVARRHTLAPDALALNPQELAVETVGERLVLGAGRRTMELYPAASAHAETMLIAYFPAERLLAEVDLYSPPPPGATGRAPFAASLLATIERLELRVDRILALHGRVVPMQDLRDAVESATEAP